MKTWLRDFPQMVPADDAEAVEVVNMVVFAAGRRAGRSWRWTVTEGILPLWMRELNYCSLSAVNPAF